MIGRVTEWTTQQKDDGFRLRLYAFAQYGRGSIPKDVEIEQLEKRVHAKYPKAEFVSAKRSFVPRSGGGSPRRVWWELCWLVLED